MLQAGWFPQQSLSVDQNFSFAVPVDSGYCGVPSRWLSMQLLDYTTGPQWGHTPTNLCKGATTIHQSHRQVVTV